jgi:uracil-DNA glycosylase
LLIGQYAQKYYLGKLRKKNLTETVRAYQTYLPNYFPLVHPSPRNLMWQRRNLWFEDEVVPELQAVVKNLLE